MDNFIVYSLGIFNLLGERILLLTNIFFTTFASVDIGTVFVIAICYNTNILWNCFY
ncbi:MAG: Na+/H+ antiporter NhaA [Bacteroidales bacterium]|nr:Na+/H+ antiporter NhaA [Bacteroidales bacterium]